MGVVDQARVDRVNTLAEAMSSQRPGGVTPERIVQDYTISEARGALEEASRQIVEAENRITLLARAKQLIKRELLGEDKPTRGA